MTYAQLIALATTMAARAADPMGEIKPLGAPVRANAVIAPLADLADGLVAYLSFDDHLISFDPLGRQVKARFRRNSTAFLPDPTEVKTNVPRYQPGKFAAGLLREYAYAPAGGDQFPPEIADATASPQVFQALADARIERATGLDGRPAVTVDDSPQRPENLGRITLGGLPVDGGNWNFSLGRSRIGLGAHGRKMPPLR